MPEYYISCKDCTFKEGVLLVNFDSLLMYLKMKKCPRCESTNLVLHIGGMSGMYKCKKCGYTGSLVVEEDDNSGD